MTGCPNHMMPLFFQQDTTQQVSLQDTSQVNTLGINPIFLQIERKAQEVEEYKQKYLLSTKRKTVKATEITVDTTCNWCIAESTTLNTNLLQLSLENETAFFEPLLYNKLFYEREIAKPTLVFIETVPNSNHKEVKNISPKPRVNTTAPLDWILFPLLLLLIISVLIKHFYNKHLDNIFKSFTFYYSATKQNKESFLNARRIFAILDFTYFIAISIGVVIAFNIIPGFSYGGLTPMLLAVIVFGGVLSFRLFQIIANKIIGYLSNSISHLDVLFFHRLVFTRVFGVVAVPFVFIMAYGKGIPQSISFYALASLFIIMLILRFFRSLKVFLNKGFSIFYFILYLCALEIIPVLIVFKEILGV